MILGFKTTINGQPTGFVEKINAGTKIHTLREDANDRWRSEMPIQFATGVRTKNYKQFKNGTCTKIQDVFMSLNNCNTIEISIDDKYMYHPDKVELAKNDGFDSLADFVKWFEPLIQQAMKNGKSGLRLRLIHWTAFRY